VVGAAIAAIRDGRYETMTIRSLAADLGVAPMTLYRHIRDRDDLLDEVTDYLLSKSWQPRKKYERWQDWIVDAAKRFRRLLVSQPAVLHVYLSHPVATPAALDRMQSMLSVLRSAGFEDGAARRTYATLHTYTIGFAALEASRSEWRSTNKSGDAIMKQLATFTTMSQFVSGLEMLLLGVERSS
jgi:AcrR family transcriptional regulator